MRISDAVQFPRNNILGAIEDPLLLSRFGRQVGKECALLGIDMSLAPVADVHLATEEALALKEAILQSVK